MDLSGISFYVENKREINLNPFPMLSGIQQSQISAPHEFQGVNLNGHKMEEHSFTNLFEMSDIKYTNNLAELRGLGYSKNVMKNEQLTTRKEMCGNYNHFSAISFSKLVGGFVGSKSQVGCANREPCQIWDIILRQLAETTYHTTNVQKSAHQCFSFGKTLSQSILDSICEESKLAFYYLSSNCRFFEDPEMSEAKLNNRHTPVQLPSMKEELALAGTSVVTYSTPVPLSRDESFISSVKNDISNSSTSSNSQKQSYAEVAKSFLSSKSEMLNVPQDFTDKTVHNKCPGGYVNKMGKEYKSVDRSNWRKKAEPINYSEPLYNTNQNYQYTSSETIHPTFKKQSPEINIDRSGNDRFEHVWKRYKPEFNYRNAKIGRQCSRKEQSSAEFKNKVAFINKRYRPIYRNPESMFQGTEEGNLNCNVVNESSCNSNTKSGKPCKNWRCKHNRIAFMDSNDFKKKVPHSNNTSHTKLPNESVPSVTSSDQENAPIMLINSGECADIDSCSKIGIQITICPQEHSQSEDRVGSQTLVRELSSSAESNSMMSLLSTSSFSNLSEGCGLRRRFSSECSIDSEDSFVVMFESDCTGDPTSRECDSRVLFQITSLDSDASDSWSDCDESDSSDMNDSDGEDQVDACHISPLLSIPGQKCSHDDFSPLSSKLQDINATWAKEYLTLPSTEKIPEKIHFACSAELTTVHPLVTWGYAYRAARCGPWEEMGRDRVRFRARVDRLEPILAPIFTSEHRAKVREERMNNSAIT